MACLMNVRDKALLKTREIAKSELGLCMFFAGSSSELESVSDSVYRDVTRNLKQPRKKYRQTLVQKRQAQKEGAPTCQMPRFHHMSGECNQHW